MPLSNLSHAELASGLRDHLLEAKSRLPTGSRRLKTLNLVHGLLEQVEDACIDEGDLTARVGGGKEEPPTNP